MRRGFTIVEMLGATVLSALLMVAVLTVVASVGRTQRAFDTATMAADDSADVFALLRFDLANARDVPRRQGHADDPRRRRAVARRCPADATAGGSRLRTRRNRRSIVARANAA